MKQRNNHILLLALLSMCGSAWAQQPGDDLSDVVIDVNTEFDPTLTDPVRVEFKGAMPEVDTRPLELNYDAPVQQPVLDYRPVLVKPIAMKPLPLDRLSNVYAQVGAGNRLLPSAEIHITSGRNKKSQNQRNTTNWGVDASFENGIGSLENQNYHEISTRLYGETFRNKMRVSGTAGWDNDVVHFYGYDNNLQIFKGEDIRRSINRFHGKVRLNDTRAGDQQWGFDIQLNGGYMGSSPYAQGLSKVSEGHGRLIAKLHRNTRKGDRFGLNVRGAILSELTMTGGTARSRSLITGNPYYAIVRDDFNARLGIKAGIDERGFVIFPDVHFERPLLDDKLIFEVGWDGYVDANHLYGLLRENPFTHVAAQGHSSQILDLFLNFKGSLGSRSTYLAGMNYRNIAYLPLFTNNLTDYKAFDVQYDTSTIQLDFHAEISHTFGEKLRLLAAGNLYSYTTKNQSKAWMLPSFRARIRADYAIGKYLRVHADLFAFGVRNALDSTGATQKLPAGIDINLGARYEVSNSFYLFGGVHNLAGSAYQRWFGYRSYGLHGVGGLILAF